MMYRVQGSRGAIVPRLFFIVAGSVCSIGDRPFSVLQPTIDSLPEHISAIDDEVMACHVCRGIRSKIDQRALQVRRIA